MLSSFSCFSTSPFTKIWRVYNIYSPPHSTVTVSLHHHSSSILLPYRFPLSLSLSLSLSNSNLSRFYYFHWSFILVAVVACSTTLTKLPPLLAWFLKSASGSFFKFILFNFHYVTILNFEMFFFFVCEIEMLIIIVFVKLKCLFVLLVKLNTYVLLLSFDEFTTLFSLIRLIRSHNSLKKKSKKLIRSNIYNVDYSIRSLIL